jgi:16S rRNA (adenine1518-N6/adenine1519-N6)-dimethyltransferase
VHGPYIKKVPRKETLSHNKVQRQLKGAGLKARKRLGQNFLVDDTIRDRIVEAAAISNADTLLEIGPGLGVLTEKLAGLARSVVAVELDENLVKRLQNKLAGIATLRIVHADILKVDLMALMGQEAQYKVVANIPYYITSPILRYFMQNELKSELMVIMMQEEVAEDVTAGPDHMTFLSVSMHLFSRPEVVFKVKADSFYPRPKVDSAVVRFNMLKKPAVPVTDVEGFLQFVHAGFAAPRKQMRNSLAIGLKIEVEQALRLLEKADIDPQRRPETLTLNEWFELCRCAEGNNADP